MMSAMSVKERARGKFHHSLTIPLNTVCRAEFRVPINNRCSISALRHFRFLKAHGNSTDARYRWSRGWVTFETRRIDATEWSEFALPDVDRLANRTLTRQKRFGKPPLDSGWRI